MQTRLDGRELKAIEAYGKHLLYEFDGRRYVHVHLGLFGKVRTAGQPAPPAGATVRMRLAVADWYADLVGPTRCRLIDGDQRRRCWPASVLTRCGVALTRRWRGADSGQQAAHRGAADGPEAWSPGSATSTAPSFSSGQGSTHTALAPTSRRRRGRGSGMTRAL